MDPCLALEFDLMNLLKICCKNIQTFSNVSFKFNLYRFLKFSVSFVGEHVITRSLAFEPWRVLGSLPTLPAPHAISLVNQAREIYNKEQAEKQTKHQHQFKRLENYFNKLAKKSPRKLKFEDIL